MNTQRILWASVSAVVLLSGCSALQPDKIDYKSVSKGSSLEIPPDLTQLSNENRYAIPGSTAVSANAYQTGVSRPATVPTSALTVGDVRIERAGSQRWLVVQRSADELWPVVRDFWKENGFNLLTEQQAVGIMETDWAENRAKIPQDIIRESVGKLFDSLYSTGERDKFRTRLERNAGSNSTEIFISHRGMVEVYTTAQKDATVWQARPDDPGLEAEFLRRLMLKLGVTQEQAKAQLASAPVQPTATVTAVNGQPVVQMQEGFDRAWRRVGLALDRTGFTVEDRDRSQGVYFVRYVEPTEVKKEQGFFSRWFSSAPAGVAPLKYKIQVRSQANTSTVAVFKTTGEPETSANAQRIVQVIADDLK